jgi:type II secretory pathway pseudopilin PulG
LLIEAVAALALLAIFLGFIFQKQLQQQKQLDEVNTAEAIKVVSDSVKQYVAANETLHPLGTTRILTVSDPAFAPFHLFLYTFFTS